MSGIRGTPKKMPKNYGNKLSVKKEKEKTNKNNKSSRKKRKHMV